MAAAAYLFWHVMTSRYRELQAGREYERPVLSFTTVVNLRTEEEQHCRYIKTLERVRVSRLWRNRTSKYVMRWS